MILLYILNIIFTVYSLMLLVRVLGSWFYSFSQSGFMRFIGFYTDPYLNLFRRIIPPIGFLDISPMVAFFVLQIFQGLLFTFLRYLF